MEYRIPQYVTVVRRVVPRQDVCRVIVHRGVTTIEEDAFLDWANLREVVFEPGSRLEMVGTYAFAGTALESFTAPRSLRRIDAGAFANCRNLREAMLNEGLQYIGESAFYGSGVETVYIPSTLREMPKGALFRCGSLKRVEVAEGCKVDVKYCV